MSKAANIYWDSRDSRTAISRRVARRRTTAKVTTARRYPWWLSFAIAVSIFVMIGVSINFRAFVETREEATQNQKLTSQIQDLMDENLALQEEIHSLKSDPAAISAQAKRIGIDLKASGQPSAVSRQQ